MYLKEKVDCFGLPGVRKLQIPSARFSEGSKRNGVGRRNL